MLRDPYETEDPYANTTTPPAPPFYERLGWYDVGGPGSGNLDVVGINGPAPPPANPGYNDRNSPPTDTPPAGYTYDWDAGSGRWYLKAIGNGPAPTGGPGGPYGGGTGQFDYGRDPSQMLPFSPYSSMAPFSFSQGPFSYAPFGGSSWEDAEKEPGFEQSQARLAKMIQNTAAYRGVLRSGATIGDLGTYLDQNKGQNFQQFDARNFRNWGANRENAADAWGRNLGMEQFAYDRASTDNDRKNNYTFNTEKSSFDDLLSRWSTLVNATAQASRPV